MNIAEAIEVLDQQVPSASRGLPDEVFYYVSSVTPLINVDLLVKDEAGRTLLSWRDDKYCGKGWHIPGGIIRHGETIETRIKKVAETEIGRAVVFDQVPFVMKQCFHLERRERSHFISLLYKCFLSKTFVPENKGLSIDDVGYLMWHDACPDNLLKVHEMYRQYI